MLPSTHHANAKIISSCQLLHKTLFLFLPFRMLRAAPTPIEQNTQPQFTHSNIRQFYYHSPTPKHQPERQLFTQTGWFSFFFFTKNLSSLRAALIPHQLPIRPARTHGIRHDGHRTDGRQRVPERTGRALRGASRRRAGSSRTAHDGQPCRRGSLRGASPVPVHDGRPLVSVLASDVVHSHRTVPCSSARTRPKGLPLRRWRTASLSLGGGRIGFERVDRTGRKTRWWWWKIELTEHLFIGRHTVFTFAAERVHA